MYFTYVYRVNDKDKYYALYVVVYAVIQILKKILASFTVTCKSLWNDDKNEGLFIVIMFVHISGVSLNY